MTARVDYTPGAGGALTGVESALSSLPSCPVYWDAAPGAHEREPTLPECGKVSHPIGGPSLRCDAGHVFAGTSAEHEQARGALAAARRRAARVRTGRPS